MPSCRCATEAYIYFSELSLNVAMLLTELLPKYIDDSCYRIVNGAVEVTTSLLDHPYGHILYTGNNVVAKLIMAAASNYLTLVTLELGGKSPVIISEHANIPLAAKRTAWGKFFNAGQTCMCADYALVDEKVLLDFLDQFKLVSLFPSRNTVHF
jgi:acyl-CoA reductase-like NAD-dependent aldehyde dehydrogenase